MPRTLPTGPDCTRCGTSNPPGTPHCGTCGAVLAGGRTPRPSPITAAVLALPTTGVRRRAASFTAPVPFQAPAVPASARNAALTGLVLRMDPPQMMTRSFRWGPFLGRLVLGVTLVVVFGTVALTFFITGMVMSVLWSIVAGSSRSASRQGFFGSLMSHAASFFVIHRFLAPKPQVPVVFGRLRDVAGLEHQFRIEGAMVSGGVNAGDDVSLNGRWQGGTLDVRGGYNHRIRSDIRITRR